MIARSTTLNLAVAPERVGPAGANPAIVRVRHWFVLAAAVPVIALVLANLPGRRLIAPNVESDYCYILLAADRLYDGLGLTAPRPVAPLQPWEWRSDWATLTQWPPAYPVLVCLVRLAAGCSTIEACQGIGVFACAAALVGWFAWIRRCVGRGIPETLLAAVGAASALTVSFLMDPSTDAVLVAATPYVLLLTARAFGEDGVPSSPVRLALAGVVAGALAWLRYAAIFLPGGALACLLIHAPTRRRAGLAGAIAYAVGAAIPIAVLVLFVCAADGSAPTSAQFNLGSHAGVRPSATALWEAWWTFTDLGFYDYLPYSHWLAALLPAGAVALLLTRRRALLCRGRAVIICLNAVVLATLFGLLIGAVTVFGDKFNYVALERYYLPVRPLYFALFVTPFLNITRHRAWRMTACVPLLLGTSWIAQQDWARTYRRWQVADRPVTRYGAWQHCFGTGAGGLYDWLETNDSPDVAVFSNFHEYIALETGIAANPIPPDRAALDRWLTRTAEGRGVDPVQPVFVLDSDNRWRDYWQPPPAGVISTFGLTPVARAPAGESFTVYCLDGELNTPGASAAVGAHP